MAATIFTVGIIIDVVCIVGLVEAFRKYDRDQARAQKRAAVFVILIVISIAGMGLASTLS